MASFADIFKAVPRAFRRRRYNDEGIPGSADPEDPTTPAALPAPVVRRRRVETLSPEVDADASARAAGIDPMTGRLMRAPRREEYSQDLEGAQGFANDTTAYVPENHNSRLASAGLTGLRGLASGGLFGGLVGLAVGAARPKTDEEYAKRVAMREAQGEIVNRFGQMKVASDLANEEAERKLRRAQAEKAMREPQPTYTIKDTETGIVGIDPHDPTKIVETGLRPPKRPESQVQYVERRLADGTVVKVPAGTALTAEATQGRFTAEQKAREADRAERRGERAEDRSDKMEERNAADDDKIWSAANADVDKFNADYKALLAGENLHMIRYYEKLPKRGPASEADYQARLQAHREQMDAINQRATELESRYPGLVKVGGNGAQLSPRRKRQRSAPRSSSPKRTSDPLGLYK